MDNKQLLTNKDLMKIFSITDATIRNWERKGILNPIRIQGKVFYERDDIDNLINKYKGKGLKNNK